MTCILELSILILCSGPLKPRISRFPVRCLMWNSVCLHRKYSKGIEIDCPYYILCVNVYCIYTYHSLVIISIMIYHHCHYYCCYYYSIIIIIHAHHQETIENPNHLNSSTKTSSRNHPSFSMSAFNTVICIKPKRCAS